MLLGKIPVKMTNAWSSWTKTFISSFLNWIKITVSSNFDIHLHSLRLQQVSLGKWSYGFYTAFTSMDWTTHLDCTSHHATHHEDYSRGLATEQCGKGDPTRNAVRSCLIYSCQGSPLKTEMANHKTFGLIWPEANHSETQTSTRRTLISWRNSQQ